MSTAVEEFIEHYGVKGMRWGVRKDRSGGSSGGSKGSSKKEATKTDEKKGSSKKGGSSDGPKGLSDKKLQKEVNRLQLEKQYRELKAKEAEATMTTGQRFVAESKQIGVNVLKTQTQNALNQYVGREINKALGTGGGKKGKKDKNKKSDDKKDDQKKDDDE